MIVLHLWLTSDRCLDAFKNWIVSIGAPVTLEEVHISKKEVDKLAAHIFRTIEMARMQELYPLETLKELLNRM
ncbi:hypothetical protein [Lacrimispora sp.]|uniref:hypothetical protein n=1 Tax=Lacrimispora sp. TaxID=2719234 RepID=UPI0032E3873B